MPCVLSVDEYPALSALVEQLDNYLEKKYPDFFGARALHPILPVKRSKVIHDNLWGTNRYSWRELVLIDSPIIQRLRDIHQVGLAFNVYPSAHHARFEPCLGVVTLASRIFDAVLDRNRGDLDNIAEVIGPGQPSATAFAQLRQELRLAALLHDTGHSLFSHTSERVYERLSVVKAASAELKKIAGKQKGAGEVISFCLAQTKSVAGLLEGSKRQLIGDTCSDDYRGEIDQLNIALLVIGRGRHPYLQFLGDIISSGFDADKLDYLLRDAVAAGLPLRYDLDRYLYAVRLEKGILVDGEGELERLYKSVAAPPLERQAARPSTRFPYYEAYRLRLPKAAMNTIEQIIICKMMLFSYLYHHPKVRAAEGTLERVLKRLVSLWRTAGETDGQILERFLGMTDSDDPQVRDYSYRLVNRLIPREVYGLAGDVASHAERPLLTDFLTDLQDRVTSPQLVSTLENAIGEELVKLDPKLGPGPEDALSTAGVWVDVPRPPEFEDVDEVVIGGTDDLSGVPLMQLFPIGQWTQAYTHFRYCVRVFSFSEYWELTKLAAKAAMQRVIRIHGDSFYEKVIRTRG
jgi:HD superfamily phosphohydrolase